MILALALTLVLGMPPSGRWGESTDDATLVIFVVGDSLRVTLTDSRGMRDEWARGEHLNRIPGIQSGSGVHSLRGFVGPYALPDAFETVYWLQTKKPVSYRIDVRAMTPQTVVALAGRPRCYCAGVSARDAADTLALARDEVFAWRLSLRKPTAEACCGTLVLKRLGRGKN